MTASSLMSGNTPSTLTDRAHATVDKAAGRAVPALERATSAVHQTVDKAAEQVAPALQRATTVAHETIDKVANVAAPVAERAAQYRQKLATRSSEVTEACSGYVRARPLTSVAGALAIGYLAGRLLR
jgi:ElaB/YqjD/DUF883 family membrane-anchored ribosome-binding protein